jgi:hypothetical protein
MSNELFLKVLTLLYIIAIIKPSTLIKLKKNRVISSKYSGTWFNL